MTDVATTPSVALLFADAGLAAHLREALTELGAHIVHEGPAAEVSRDALAGADVVVVNLEPDAETQLDRIYDAVDTGSCKIIFDDAEISRKLTGWDRARWARHLAAKLVGGTDVDPPRPADARGVESAAGAQAAAEAIAPAQDVAAAVDQPASAAIDATSAATELKPDDDAGVSSVAIEERQTIGESSAVADWELIDFDAAAPADPPPRDDARDFGVEKMRAEDFLAPDTTVDDSPVEPGIEELELVSLEESVAPTMFDEAASEMVLGEGMGSVRRVVVMGAGSEGHAEVAAFLAALSPDLPAVVIVVQHQREQALDELVAGLDDAAALPVALARDETTVRQGQVWLVPAGQTCRLRRDGALRLAAVGTTILGNPSIDECLTALAEVFGTDLTAVVLAGAGYDALAGAQEVHDHGGRVWIQNPETCGDDSMAMAIDSEGLATASGAPDELARRLAEEFA